MSEEEDYHDACDDVHGHFCDVDQNDGTFWKVCLPCNEDESVDKVNKMLDHDEVTITCAADLSILLYIVPSAAIVVLIIIIALLHCGLKSRGISPQPYMDQLEEEKSSSASGSGSGSSSSSSSSSDSGSGSSSGSGSGSDSDSDSGSGSGSSGSDESSS